MTVWKVALTHTDSPTYRTVVEAKTMDLAIAGAKLGFGQSICSAGAQAMNDLELANREAATAHFIENGFFPLFTIDAPANLP